jgi:hypothetical protein
MHVLSLKEKYIRIILMRLLSRVMQICIYSKGHKTSDSRKLNKYENRDVKKHTNFQQKCTKIT